MIRLLILCGSLGVLVIGLMPAPANSADPKDPKLKLSFVFMGCNRVDHKDWDPKANPSSANLPQLKQSFADIAALDPAPALFFFTGDLVMNLAEDKGDTLKGQLAAWTDVYTKHGPAKGKTTLVPLPGNHEMLMEIKLDKKDKDGKHIKEEVPNKHSDSVWLDWLKTSKFDTYAKVANGPKPDKANEDKLVNDQSQLTYSFDAGDIHFVVINTDTISSAVDKETKYPFAGWVPYNWIKKDVEAAQANPKISAIFLLGHKPIMDNPKKEEDSILNAGKHMLGDALQQLFKANAKVRAYLCAHEHVWDRSPLPLAPKVPQVVAGNAGSPLNASWAPKGGVYYGFTEIRVYDNGKVDLVNHKRPLPPGKQKYFEGTPIAPPAAQAEIQPPIFPGR